MKKVKYISYPIHAIADDGTIRLRPLCGEDVVCFAEKNFIKRKVKTNYVKSFTLIVALMVVMNVSSLITVRPTQAYAKDSEQAIGNELIAGTLDFSLTSDMWQLPETASSVLPGTSVSRNTDIAKEGSLPFQYTVSSTFAGGNESFCSALNLEASLDSFVVWSGPLKNFFYGPAVFSEPEDWSFVASLPSGSPTYGGEVCQFNFVFEGWQDSLATSTLGFHETVILANQLNGGIETSSGTEGYRPVMDSYVAENHKNSNFGDSSKVKVKSKEKKNNRTFIAFNIHLPGGTVVVSSTLYMFLSDAPPDSRTYEARRVIGLWDEDSLTWNNQPGVLGGVSDTDGTGVTDKVWLSWNVTSDMEGFVGGTFPNYGWRVSDSAEDEHISQNGQLRSREYNSDVTKRPVLDVELIVPVATTTHVVINEVLNYVDNPEQGHEGDNEWVEVYNPTENPVDISNWEICDASTCDVIPVSPPIPGKGFALITPEDSTWEKWPDIPVGTVLIVLDSNIGSSLSNSGDRVVLRDASSTVVDAMSYGSDASILNPSVPKAFKGDSLARVIKGFDFDSANDWVVNATPNPGTNPSEGGREVMRFTAYGIEVAGKEKGLPPPGEGNNDEVEVEEEVSEEQEEVLDATSTMATVSGENQNEPTEKESPVSEVSGQNAVIAPPRELESSGSEIEEGGSGNEGNGDDANVQAPEDAISGGVSDNVPQENEEVENSTSTIEESSGMAEVITGEQPQIDLQQEEEESDSETEDVIAEESQTEESKIEKDEKDIEEVVNGEIAEEVQSNAQEQAQEQKEPKAQTNEFEDNNTTQHNETSVSLEAIAESESKTEVEIVTSEGNAANVEAEGESMVQE